MRDDVMVLDFQVVNKAFQALLKLPRDSVHMTLKLVIPLIPLPTS